MLTWKAYATCMTKSLPVALKKVWKKNYKRKRKNCKEINISSIEQYCLYEYFRDVAVI